MTYKIDAANQSLGRLASKIALILRGKNDPKFQPYVLPDERVIVYNIDRIKITGKKLQQKKYYRHSGYPGGIKEERMADIFKKDSRMVFKKAVWGMLPKNRLRKQIMKNLILHNKEIS